MKSQQGFTLIEIMMVVIIIGILTALTVPRLSGRTEQARKTAARTDIEANLSIALDLYEMDQGSYPNTEQGLDSLVRRPSGDEAIDWKGPYLKKKMVPTDPWGRAYQYVCPGEWNPETYDVFSLGPDGIESADDIGNWEKDHENDISRR